MLTLFSTAREDSETSAWKKRKACRCYSQ